eukprot:2723059-Rhodomonas_salina.1
MQVVIKAVCKITRVVVKAVHFVWCKLLKPLQKEIIKALQGVIDFVEDTLNSVCVWGDCGFSLGFLHDVIAVINKLFIDGSDDFCANDGDVPCEEAFTPEDVEPTGALPVPTRCWTEFVPMAGVSTQL